MNETVPKTPAQRESAVRARFEEERRQKTRTSVIAGGLVAIVGMPTWSLFDLILVPEDAWQFTLIRFAATVAIGLSLAVLFLTDFGRRRPELCGLGVVGSVQVAIAAMVVQLADHHAAYALGMSLAIYASGFLLAWRARYTLLLVAISLTSLALGWLISSQPASASEIATVAFYLATASLVAVAGQLVRDRVVWREFQNRAELELEQARTRELVEKLDRLSHEDALTGLANRRAWDEAIAREGARLAREPDEYKASILLCDIDRLKKVNDHSGHGRGDAVLREVATLFRGRIRAADLVARIGGDEFAILASGSDEVEAGTLARDLRDLVVAARLGAPEDPVTVSIGVAEWQGARDTAETVLERADRRLYAAKATRNTVQSGEAETAGA